MDGFCEIFLMKSLFLTSLQQFFKPLFVREILNSCERWFFVEGLTSSLCGSANLWKEGHFFWPLLGDFSCQISLWKILNVYLTWEKEIESKSLIFKIACVFNSEILFFRGMMMTACDVSAITKPWEVQQRVDIHI